MVTQNFGRRQNRTFVLGVAYTDKDRNRFYSPGEGRSDLAIAATGGGSASTSTSGGYSLETGLGTQTIALAGGGLRGPVSVTASITTNLKLDLVDGRNLFSSGPVEVAGPIAELRALGVAGLSLRAGKGNQVLAGTRGNDVLDGGEGADIAEFTGHHASYRVQGMAGDLSVSGPDGTDRLLNIEVLRFADGDFDWGRSGKLALSDRRR